MYVNIASTWKKEGDEGKKRKGSLKKLLGDR
jgi:hypothetical protein